MMPLAWKLAALYSRISPTNRGAYALARWARKSLPRDRWSSQFQTPDRLKLNLDISTYPDCNMALGLYETETARLIQKLLGPNKKFADCGANIGYFTLFAAKNGARVDAFEPDPINRARLAEHLALNQLTNVTIHPLAVSDRAEQLEFFHPTGPLNHGQASRYASLVPESTRYTVNAARLDEVLPTPPDLIKMDVEGGELAALRGCEKFIISATPPDFIIEHNHESATAAGFTPAQMFEFLVQHQPRYRIYWIAWRLKRIHNADDLQSIARQGNILVSVR